MKRRRTDSQRTTLAGIPFMLAGIAFAAYCVAQANAMRVRDVQRDALACARASVADFDSEDAGTDQAIADCYTVRGLPVPSDLGE